MAVKIGSARINEIGQISGGIPGDQTGKECCTEDWYMHSYGWVVIRAKDKQVRERIALDMEYICDNDNIGYDQPRDQSLYVASKPYGFNASKVTTRCDTDCARAVRVCVLFAGIDVKDFYTATEIETLRATGAFDVLYDEKYCASPDYLLRGDILCTPVQGHTVVVLTDGPRAHDLPTDPYKITNCYQCNMRSGPGMNYAVVEVLTNGDEVGLISWSDNDWGQIRHGDNVGYVFGEYLEPEKDVAITTGDVWQRKNAGVDGAPIQVIPAGERVKILSAAWYEVQYQGKKGWTSGKYLRV